MVLSYLDFRNNSLSIISLRNYSRFIIMINGNSRFIGITFTPDKFCNYNLFCNSFIKNKCIGHVWINNQLFRAVRFDDSKYNSN